MLYHSTFPPVIYEGSIFSIFLPNLLLSVFLNFSLPGDCEMVYHCGFDLYFLMADVVEHLFLILLVISISSLEVNAYSDLLLILKLLFILLLLDYNGSLCIMDISPLSETRFANIFSYPVACLFIFLVVSLKQKYFKFNKV